MALSPSASAMIDEAINDGWNIALEDLNGPDFHIDVPEKIIALDSLGMSIQALGRSSYFRNALLVSFIRALRDVWQEKRHGGFDDEYGPENILMLERVRAADLDVLAVLVAWELRSEQCVSLWRHMLGSEEGDIAMRYSGAMERDPASAFNGQALAMAFDQWFRDKQRVSACEHEILDDLDMIISERQLEGDYPVFGKEALKPIKLEMLSCLPDRTAYLQGSGRDLMSNPLYAGMNSAVNQAHLMQVLHDMRVVRVHDVPFRDAELAFKIFPNGQFSKEL